MILAREKILSGLDNYEMNTGTMHPLIVKGNESELGTRGASIPLTADSALWSGEISIGTPPKTLKVYMDTGAADMWVLQTGCDGISGDRDLWDPYSSKSAKKQTQPFQITYVDGSITEGDRYTDNVAIGGFTSGAQTFGSATSFTAAMLHINAFTDSDGLLGLAFPFISGFGAYPWFASLVRQGRLMNPTFSLKLSSSGAEMYVGGANGMLYNGVITYTRVTNPGFWQVTMDDFRVDGDIIFKNVPVILDTGASYILGDWNGVAALYRRLDGTLLEHAGLGYYSLPCKSFPTLGLTFGGRTFKIPPEVFRMIPVEKGSPDCFGSIIGQRSPVEFWNIGLVFLQGVYSVFDYNRLQVGFADLA